MPGWLLNASPLLVRFKDYRRETLVGDLIAGFVVAVMLVPQAMAYAMLAGLPPQIGLYASIVPLFLYALFGTSNTLSVGPVAMISLLVVSGVREHAEPGSSEFIAHCLTLALLVGVIQILMALFRMGFLVNFISHSVLTGFTSAAAIVIAFSQVKHLLGVPVEATEYPFQMIAATLSKLGESNPATLMLGLASILLLILFAVAVGPVLKRIGLSESWATSICKTGPLVAVIATATTVVAIGLNETRSVAIVGEIPAGLPTLTLPDLSMDTIRRLLPLALVITLVGYLESISVAKALASRRGEKVDPNRELFALGLADIGAAFTGGYPVTGGFSRSLVNFTAGARTPIATIVSATIVAMAIVLLTHWFFYIPKAVLAAIIVVAVVGLIDVKSPFKLWQYSRADAVALIVTFVAVLALGIETGILVGIVSTIVMLMWNISRPHIAEVGRVGGSEHFRNIERHNVHRADEVLVLRVDESLNFANAPLLESYVLEKVASRPEIESVLLIASGINGIDATGIEILDSIHGKLNSSGIEFYMSDVKGPVLDRIRSSGFDEEFVEKRVFLSAHLAMACIEANQADTGIESKEPVSGCQHV